MRKRHFLVLAAVVCLVMPVFVLSAEARSGVRVTHVSKRKLSLAVKATGEFSYNAKLNRWESLDKHPVVFKPVLIGKQKVPAYYEAGNMMAEPCDHSYIIITDQKYAIVISTDCGDSDERLSKYVKSFSLPKGVHAIKAKEEAGWEVIE